jgi:hypothetical protein
MRHARSILAVAAFSLVVGCGDDTETDDPPIGPGPDAAVEEPPTPDASVEEPGPDAATPPPPPDAGTTTTPDAAVPTVPDSSVPTRNCAGTSMELGTGVRQFQAVRDGDTVYLYRGPQGGYMIYLSVRAKGLDPNDVTLCYKERFTDTGKLFGEGCWKVRLTNDLGNGTYERIGVWGQVDPYYWTRPGAIRGKDATVDVTLVDSKGCGEDARWSVHISPDPGA